MVPSTQTPHTPGIPAAQTPAEEREAHNTRSRHRHSMSAGAPCASGSCQRLVPAARGCRHLAEPLVDLWTWRGILWMSRALQPFLMRPAPDQPSVIHRHARGVPRILESIRFVRSIRARHPAHPATPHPAPRARRPKSDGSETEGEDISMARCALASELRWRDGERIIQCRLAQFMLNQQSANSRPVFGCRRATQRRGRTSAEPAESQPRGDREATKS